MSVLLFFGSGSGGGGGTTGSPIGLLLALTQVVSSGGGGEGTPIGLLLALTKAISGGTTVDTTPHIPRPEVNAGGAGAPHRKGRTTGPAFGKRKPLEFYELYPELKPPEPEEIPGEQPLALDEPQVETPAPVTLAAQSPVSDLLGKGAAIKVRTPIKDHLALLDDDDEAIALILSTLH